MQEYNCIFNNFTTKKQLIKLCKIFWFHLVHYNRNEVHIININANISISVLFLVQIQFLQYHANLAVPIQIQRGNKICICRADQ